MRKQKGGTQTVISGKKMLIAILVYGWNYSVIFKNIVLWPLSADSVYMVESLGLNRTNASLLELSLAISLVIENRGQQVHV